MKTLSRLSLNTTRRKGFTLIEILVVTVIFSIVATSLFIVFKAGLDSWRRTQAHLDVYQNARAALDMITRDLTAAYLNPANSSISFKATDNSAPTGWTPTTDDVVYFTAALNPALNKADATFELCKVGYWRDANNKLQRVFVWPISTSTPSTFFIFTSTDQYRCYLVASNISNFQLTYYDSTGATTTTWNSTAGAQLNKLPSMVQIALTVTEPTSGKAQTFTTNVYIPASQQ